MTDQFPDGVYAHLLTEEIRRALEAESLLGDPVRARIEKPDDTELPSFVGYQVGEWVRRTIEGLPDKDKAERVARIIAAVHLVTATEGRAVDDGDQIVTPIQVLRALRRHRAGDARDLPLPSIGLRDNALLTNRRDEPRIGHELRAEIGTADRIDLLCAFIKWEGLRLLEGPLRDAIARGVKARIITTTYMGATQRRALDKLVEWGAEVRVSYETKQTRLHAKAWLFTRASGLSTAYVGSSNLSHVALVDGLEWNLRITSARDLAVIDAVRASFDVYWNDPASEDYHGPRDAAHQQQFDDAIAEERGGPGKIVTNFVPGLQVRPLPHQQEILDDLAAQRDERGLTRSLVVAATGTGKTVLAALDYKRLRAAGKVSSLLFVAHRKEILEQSLATFRQVLGEGSFGELYVDGSRPRAWTHVFASIQSLSRAEALARLDPPQFSMVVVDEFHHAAAPTYQELLNRVQPIYLLGLTATPERGDGGTVQDYFHADGVTELRLWAALERGLLSPFHYFAIDDGTSLEGLTWSRRKGGYLPGELERVYLNNHDRLRRIIRAAQEKISNIETMKGLGFCVSKAHAEWMAKETSEKFGLPARAITADTDRNVRADALKALEGGDLRMVYAVDVLNEGVDVPAVDTIFMLRPTDSPTLFLQQLGRGLRLSEGKSCLTVLDFVGNVHREFRFDRKLAALLDTGSRGQVKTAIEHQFPDLPPGCEIQLDEVTQKRVLDRIREAIRGSIDQWAAELRGQGDVSFGQFLTEANVSVREFYEKTGRFGGWQGLRHRAGLSTDEVSTDFSVLARVGHFDDPWRLDWLASGAVPGDAPSADRLRLMIYRALDGRTRPSEEMASRFAEIARPEWRHELQHLSNVLRHRVHLLHPVVDEARPLRLHATYDRAEVAAAFGVVDASSWRQGVQWLEDEKSDVFFVTLNKSEQFFAPSVQYRDYFISPTEFHWESQNNTAPTSSTGRRYQRHAEMGTAVHLFVRHHTKDDKGNTVPFTYAGPMTYLRHEGSKPMSIWWHLAHPMPERFLRAG